MGILDMNTVLRMIFILVVAGLMSYAATPIVRVIAFKIGAVDVPKDERRVHKKPIARLGGLAIFYGFIVAVFCFCNIDHQLQGILIGAVIIVGMGIIDDIRGIRASIKFLVQIIAAMVVVYHGVKIDNFTNPFGGYIKLGPYAAPITVLWIVGITNAVNLIDGLDGLAVGISSITAVTLVTIALITGDYSTAMVVLALAGAGFGFIPHNFFPAKIFMGDTGSTFLGFTLGCIAVTGLFKVYAVISFAVPFLILALPIFDTGFAIIRRIAKGQSPMAPDRGHLHHRLIDMGFTQKQAVVILYITSAMLSMSAVVMMISGALRAVVLILAVIIMVLGGKRFIAEAINTEEEKND